MRLGVSSDLGYKDAEQWGAKMRKLGCGSVVFPVDYLAEESQIQAYVAAAKKYDLVIAEVGAWCSPIASEEKTRKAALERCRGQLALAERIGARCCVNVAGSMGKRWDGHYRENLSREVWDKTVSSIQEIIDGVNPTHTFYTIEPMPWMYPMGPDEYVRLIQEVNREAFAVHLDVFNWITDLRRYYYSGEFIEECFEKLGPYIKSMHLKDVALQEAFTLQLKEVSCGEGEVDLQRYMQLADSVSPDMPMIIEHLDSDGAYLESLEKVKKIAKGI
ncbi:MAG: TIM barrel protein [Lachnospiraceae bacterium]|nr:TIM barrel protein [Lachnospiraceae bacterium]